MGIDLVLNLHCYRRRGQDIFGDTTIPWSRGQDSKTLESAPQNNTGPERLLLRTLLLCCRNWIRCGTGTLVVVRLRLGALLRRRLLLAYR